MVRRRSTVRFRNGAPAQGIISNVLNILGSHSGSQVAPHSGTISVRPLRTSNAPGTVLPPLLCPAHGCAADHSLSVCSARRRLPSADAFRPTERDLGDDDVRTPDRLSAGWFAAGSRLPHQHLGQGTSGTGAVGRHAPLVTCTIGGNRRSSPFTTAISALAIKMRQTSWSGSPGWAPIRGFGSCSRDGLA